MTKYEPSPIVRGGSPDTIGATLSALASERRRAVFTRLCRGRATTSELAAETGAGLPTMQQHLQRLREAGLITSTKRGRTVTHVADVAPLADLDEWLAVRRSFWNAQLGDLADALEGSDVD